MMKKRIFSYSLFILLMTGHFQSNGQFESKNHVNKLVQSGSFLTTNTKHLQWFAFIYEIRSYYKFKDGFLIEPGIIIENIGLKQKIPKLSQIPYKINLKLNYSNINLMDFNQFYYDQKGNQVFRGNNNSYKYEISGTDYVGLIPTLFYILGKSLTGGQ